MSDRTAVIVDAGPSARDLITSRSGHPRFLLLVACCGLVSGLLEVGVTILRKHTFDINRLYWTSRHFIWLVPLTDVLLFVALGVPLWLLEWRGGPRERWLARRLLCALALLPPIWAASPRIFGPAGVLLALGAATRLVPALELRPRGLRRALRLGLPAAAGLVFILAASTVAGDWINQAREAGRPLPPAGTPNVVLIVLDTVAADHLSVYGYDRPTSPTLEELAARGVRFDRAQAASSWTLQSHASMFTGRWPHEISAGWVTPLDGARPTLAGFLGDRGFATAGFTANPWYCAADSGLGRGFATFRDYIFGRLSAFNAAVLVHRPLDGLMTAGEGLAERLGFDLLRPATRRLWWLFHSDRKDAARINREFLDWLDRRRQPDRPFFAFLNFYDAHFPYRISEKGIHRFTVPGGEEAASDPVENPLQAARGDASRQQVARDRDAYDDCIADLDEEVGRMIDRLGRRGVLERTWLFIVADHGESFGEHPGVFRHGTSLYATELRVPLLIVPPRSAAGRSGRVVTEPVSLHDLAPTIVEVAGLRDGSPFPGASLLAPPGVDAAGPRAGEPPATLSEVVPLDGLNPDPAQLLEPRNPLAALSEGNWKYIRREGDVREELFHTGRDPRESQDLAGDPAMRPILDRMRRTLDRLTAGPLTQSRFNP